MLKKTLTTVFKIALPFLLFGYLFSLIDIVTAVSISDKLQLIFLASTAGAVVLSAVFVPTHGYLAVLLHELTHNLWGVLTFNKPVGLEVQANMGGRFVFHGSHNIMSVLSPYFFPMVTFIIFPFYFLLASSGAGVYFGLLGATYGLSLSIGIRQCHPQQPDLHVYGKVWSYGIILFFTLLILGFLLAFVIGRMPMAIGFLKSGIENIIDFFMVVVEMVKARL